MQSIMTGECHCGAVTYRLRSASLLTYVCHYGNCHYMPASISQQSCDPTEAQWQRIWNGNGDPYR